MGNIIDTDATIKIVAKNAKITILGELLSVSDTM